jgi:methionine synthase I (cobalamin-dependent)
VILVNLCDLRLVDDSIHEIQTALNNLKTSEETNALKKNDVQIGTYPNAFPPDAANQTLRKVDFNISPHVMKCNASKWIESGATVIGGCCGVNPDHIRAMASLSVTKACNRYSEESR